jgi:hypothetical protein
LLIGKLIKKFFLKKIYMIFENVGKWNKFGKSDNIKAFKLCPPSGLVDQGGHTQLLWSWWYRFDPCHL